MPDRPERKMGRDQLYCNDLCGRLFRGETVWLEKPTHCLWCNAELVQHGAGNPKKFCSRKHSESYRQSLKPKVSKINKICVWCGNDFVTNRQQGRFCQAICRAKYYRSEKLEATKIKQAANPRRLDYDCDRCGQLVISDKRVTRGTNGRYCRVCSLVKRRESYRIKTARRQGVAKPSRLSADFLINRDGNLCRLCNTEIDLTLPRNDRFGATIDHVVPLSKGGSDDVENMQLAHWICNIRKGNRVDA